MTDTDTDRDPEPEPVNTTVSTEALLQLFRDRATRALDSDDDGTNPKYTLQNIRDVCEAVLEDQDQDDDG